MKRCENTDCLKPCLIGSKDFTGINCENCGDIFCSIQCMEVFMTRHKQICFKLTKEMTQATLGSMGYKKNSSVALTKIMGRDYFIFPGPITGTLQPKMIPIRETRYAELLSQQERENISDSSVYYIVSSDDICKLYAYELSITQKKELGSLVTTS